MLPEVLEYNFENNSIKLTQQGNYIIKLLSINGEYPDSFSIGN